MSINFSNKINPLITVVIPTLNSRQKYLEEALDSIEKQSYRPHEIIIVNNGIGDVNVPDYSSSIRHVKTVFKSGAPQARNLGVTLAKTDFVAFLDDDDLWEKDYLQKMVRHIKNYSPDCLIAKLDQLVDGNILKYKNADSMISKNILLIKNPGCTDSTMIVKKSSYLKVGGCNAKLTSGYDRALVLDFLLQKFKIMTAPDCQAILRQHNNNDRLSGGQNLLEGISKFYKLYKNEMSLYQKIYNNLKFLRYSWKINRDLMSLGIYIFFFSTLKPIELILKHLNKQEY